MAIKDETLEDRFYRNVNVGRDDECWIWHGNRNSAGYGQMTWHKNKYAAHRLAYELHHGPITERNVCHTCDVRGCVNYRHLYQASQSKNMRDAVAKGRISPLILEKIARTGSTPESREAKRIEREKRRAAGPIFDVGARRRDEYGRFIKQGQQHVGRQRDHMGRFLK